MGLVAWIFSPSLGLERDRALAGNVVQTLTESLRSAAYDEDRARDLVVALRREMPRIERLDGVDRDRSWSRCSVLRTHCASVRTTRPCIAPH